MKCSEKSSFVKASNTDLYNEIKPQNSRKASVQDDIPTKILKETSENTTKYVKEIYNKSIETCIFPDSLKLADVIPSYKRDARTEKENYRPVSLLPIVSKLYERNMYAQIINDVNKYLSPDLFFCCCCFFYAFLSRDDDNPRRVN